MSDRSYPARPQRRPHTVVGMLAMLTRLHPRLALGVAAAAVLVLAGFAPIGRAVRGRGVHSVQAASLPLEASMSDPGSPQLVPFGAGYLAFFRTGTRMLAYARLDGDGRATSPAREIQPVDGFHAARVGAELVVGCTRDRNRGDDAEPGLDELSTWRFDAARDALEPTWTLPRQSVTLHGGPRVVPGPGGGFSLLWSHGYGGTLSSQSFDRQARPVGAPRRSASYGESSRALAVARRAGGYHALLVVHHEAFGASALVLLPGVDRATFPPARTLVADMGRTRPNLAFTEAPDRAVAGLLWSTQRETRLWFAQLADDAVGAPVSIAAGREISDVALGAGPHGWVVLWNQAPTRPEWDRPTQAALLDPDGRVVRAGVLHRYPQALSAPVWTGHDWMVLVGADLDCSLRAARIAADGATMTEPRCVL